DANEASLVLASGQAAKVLLSSGNPEELLQEFFKACLRSVHDGANAPIWKVPTGEAFKLRAVPIGSHGNGNGHAHSASLLLIHFERQIVKLPPEAERAELEVAAQARGMSKC